MKKCSKCKTKRKLKEFHPKKTSKDGFASQCKQCLREKAKERYLQNRDKHLKSFKEYRIKNKEALNKYDRDRWETRKKERKKNKAKITEYRREYEKNRRATDPVWRLKKNLRCLLWRFIYKTKENRSSKSMTKMVEITGATSKEVRIFIESKFVKGMTWNNYGKNPNNWQIDHIIPLSKFDLTKEEELKKAFHYTNMQPLWSTDNMKKFTR